MGFRSTRVRNRQPEYTEDKDSTKNAVFVLGVLRLFLFLSYTPVMVLDTKNGIPTSDAAGYELNGAESIELGSAISDKKIRDRGNSMNKCDDCKFCDQDYIFDEDEGEEYPLFTCEKGQDDYMISDEDCPFFVKYSLKKHVEEDTKCDKCKFLKECILNGNVIDVSEFGDEQSHWVGALETCKLSNI